MYPSARLCLLATIVAASACSSARPYTTTVGVLHPGMTLRVRAADAAVAAYQPATGQPRDRFTVAVTAAAKGTPPPAPLIRPVSGGVEVDAPYRVASLLVRVPDGVTLDVISKRGDVNVTAISGNANVRARRGNVRIMVPGYAQAAVGRGDLSVTIGTQTWPGTLHLSTQRGNIEVWIDPRAAFRVRLHTGNGTLFTDFGLRGTSAGTSETILGSVNGGGDQSIDVEAGTGTIRLLRLTPQA